MIDRGHDLPLAQQCWILELSRSSQYYQSVPVSERDLGLMRAIDDSTSSTRSMAAGAYAMH